MNKKMPKPLKKTITYMHRMINTGKWKANTRIPTLASIADSITVSVHTVRKARAILEHERYLDNNGIFGYCVVPPDLTRLYFSNRQLYYLRLLKLNLQSLEMINKGAKAIGKYIIYTDKDVMEIQDVLSGDKVKTSRSELIESIENPVSLASLVKLKGQELKKERIKYFRQQKLREMAKVVLRYKEN